MENDVQLRKIQMTNRRSLKQRVKRSLNPLVIVVIHATHIKIFGKHIFLNKYTRRIPGFNQILRRIDIITMSAYTQKEKEKEYKKWVNLNFPTKAKITEQKIHQKKFQHRPLISV